MPKQYPPNFGARSSTCWRSVAPCDGCRSICRSATRRSATGASRSRRIPGGSQVRPLPIVGSRSPPDGGASSWRPSEPSPGTPPSRGERRCPPEKGGSKPSRCWPPNGYRSSSAARSWMFRNPALRLADSSALGARAAARPVDRADPAGARRLRWRLRWHAGAYELMVGRDVAFGRVVGRSVDATQTAVLVTSAPGMAIGDRTPSAGTLIHSDHGVQFTSWAHSQRPGHPA